MVYTYPLRWPVGWPRTDYTIVGKFRVSREKALKDLVYELEYIDASNVVISTNHELRVDGQPRRDRWPDDHGVALYFTRNGKEVCIPCDKFASIDANIRAIGVTLTILRQLERYGTSQMVDAAFAGFTAIPAYATSGTPIVPPQPWYDVLHVAPDAPDYIVEAAYKGAMKNSHPDTGGSQERFEAVQRAYQEAKQR